MYAIRSYYEENGGLTRANGKKFEDMILSRIGSEDSATLYKSFRGKDPGINALLENRGLTEQ